MTNRLPLDRLPKRDPDGLKAAQDQDFEKEMEQIKKEFAQRLYLAFNVERPAHIAQALETTDATISSYVKGLRLPIPEMLIKIQRKTGVSLNWLLLGKGRKYLEADHSQAFSEEELEEIELLAKASGRTVQEEIRALALSGFTAKHSYDKS